MFCSNRTKRRFKRSWFPVALIILIVLEITSPVYPWAEGKIMPVIENFKIVVGNPDDTDAEWTEISGSFDKVRNCDMENLMWYRGDPKGLNTNITVTFARLPVFGIGHHYFTDIKLNLPPSEIKQSFAFVYHHCHGLYHTKTVIYP